MMGLPFLIKQYRSSNRLKTDGSAGSTLLNPTHRRITWDWAHSQLLLITTLHSGCPSTNLPLFVCFTLTSDKLHLDAPPAHILYNHLTLSIILLLFYYFYYLLARQHAMRPLYTNILIYNITKLVTKTKQNIKAIEAWITLTNAIRSWQEINNISMQPLIIKLQKRLWRNIYLLFSSP